MINTTAEVSKVPEPIDNETLQRMVYKHIPCVHAHDGASSNVAFSLLKRRRGLRFCYAFFKCPFSELDGRSCGR